MKAIVEIELNNSRNQYSEDELREMFEEDCPKGYIAIDEAELLRDVKDDSFFLFKLIRWER